MRMCTTIIYTDKLADVSAFYTTHFAYLPTEADYTNTFSLMPGPEVRLTWVDAASAGVPTSQNIVLRIAVVDTLMERAELLAAGVACSELRVEDWGPFFGQAVRYFDMIDPSGAHLQYYESDFGENRQLMTTGMGVGTREVQAQTNKSETRSWQK